MRKIFLLRGEPASGKSTWIRENHLEPYTLSADSVRLIMSSPNYCSDGTCKISQDKDSKVWSFIKETIQDRMTHGEMIIVDATHYKSSLLQPYQQMAKDNRYRLFVVDFTGVPLETLLERNANRPQHQVVPEAVIMQMHDVITSDLEVNNRFKVLTQDEAIQEINSVHKLDCDKYKKLVFFGDIHGCYEPLKEYFNNEPFNEETLYIFTGDYIDRGIQNCEVLQFMLSIYNKDNVITLEGNHEISLRKFCSKSKLDFKFDSEEDKRIARKYFRSKTIKDLYKNNIKSTEFLDNTVPQIRCLPEKELRQFCAKLWQCAVLNFHGKIYVVTHGGIPCLPNAKISGEQIIRGVGLYPEISKVYETWSNTFEENIVMVHAHRNVQEFPIKVKENIYNLCDTIESGGNLRILTVTENGSKEIMIKNNIFKPKEDTEKDEIVSKKEFHDVKDIFDQMGKSKLVRTKRLLDNVVSFNFTRDAFYDQKWNSLTTTARGLFVDLDKREIVARSFNKFFNIEEREETSLKGICNNIEFPVNVYKKENGFLGIVSIYNDKLFVCSKSTNKGPFAEMFRSTLVKTLKKSGIKKLKEMLRANPEQSFVFECIHHEDPHIIKYAEDFVCLLEVFENTLEEKHVTYKELSTISEELACPVKEIYKVISNKEDLVEWIMQVQKDDTIKFEGFVAEGANNFKFKIKSNYYRYWKQLRTALERLQKGAVCRRDFISREGLKVVQVMENIGRTDLQTMSIIDIRDIIERGIND